MAEHKNFHERLEEREKKAKNPVVKDALWWFIHLTNIEKMTEWVGGWNVSRGMFLTAIFFGEFFVIGHLVSNIALFTIGWIVGTAPIWLPIGLTYGFWESWMSYLNALYLSGRHPILFEVRIPREITRSPRAMEIALTNLFQTSGETTFLHRAWKGQVRPFFSFELASFGGDVHLYIWTWENYKNLVETMMYSYYPELELVAVEDYASRFRFDPAKHSIFATNYMLVSPDPVGKYGKGQFSKVDAHPIKSYIDFELEKDPKEEFKVDPIATILEFLSSIKPHEQIWVQLIIRAAGKYGVLRTADRHKDWQKAVRDEVERIRELATKFPGQDAQIEEAKEARPQLRFPHPTPSQTEEMQRMERHYAKYPFEVIGRALYISDGDLHGPTFTNMRWLFKPFNNQNFGSYIRPQWMSNDFDYPWADFHDIRWNLTAERQLEAYRRRGGFRGPYLTESFILTNESLASIWHPPSRAAAAPGLQRIPATKAEPPINLPV